MSNSGKPFNIILPYTSVIQFTLKEPFLINRM